MASPLVADESQGAAERLTKDPAPGDFPARTIDALEAPSVAQDRYTPEQRYHETMRVQEVLKQVALQVAQHSAREAAPEPAARGTRAPH